MVALGKSGKDIMLSFVVNCRVTSYNIILIVYYKIYHNRGQLWTKLSLQVLELKPQVSVI